MVNVGEYASPMDPVQGAEERCFSARSPKHPITDHHRIDLSDLRFC